MVYIYIESVPNRSSPPAILLRESFRDVFQRRSHESVPSARIGGELSRRAHAIGCRWAEQLVLQTLLELQGQLEGVDPAYRSERAC